jgi:hypothetical protein
MKKTLLILFCIACLAPGCSKETPDEALVGEARAMLTETAMRVESFTTALAAATNGTMAAAAVDIHLTNVTLLARRGQELEKRFPGWKEAARHTVLEKEVRRLREVLGASGKTLNNAQGLYGNDAAFRKAMESLRQASLPVQK